RIPQGFLTSISAEIHPPSTWLAQARASSEPSLPLEQPPPLPPPTSARSNSSRGKRPMSEEAPPSPPRYRGSGNYSLLHPIVESDEARPPLYKSFYDDFPEESFRKTVLTC
ncbi:hypothetical protein PIB30_106009, partial [Stylosanthes scabra]|nr:hypothetical protein [Stylosanthes scabra]